MAFRSALIEGGEEPMSQDSWSLLNPNPYLSHPEGTSEDSASRDDGVEVMGPEQYHQPFQSWSPMVL